MSKLVKYSLLTLKVALPVCLVLAGTDAFAASEVKTIGGQLGNLETDVEAGGSLFKTIVALAGAFLAALGCYGLYKYQDDPREFPMGKSLMAIVAGGLLLGFSAFTEMASGTATNSTVEEAEVFEKK